MEKLSMERYLCTNCGHHFESEPLENLMCPKCFWSTSVKKEEPAASTPKSPRKQEALSPRVEKPSPFWFWRGGIIFILILVLTAFFAIHYFQNQNDILHKIETKNAEIIASKAPELTLLPAEREILTHKITVALKGELTESEKAVLNRRIPLHSSLPEGLPAPPWDEKQFDEFLKAQGSVYKLPLEWTYRRQLKQLFKTHYVMAAQAFEKKDFLTARDEWIRSLTFPIYQSDVRKHRGIVLTMLRPFINDTLSKIGRMNALLTEKDLFASEQKLTEAYTHLDQLLQKQSWEEANAELLELNHQVDETSQAQRIGNPPPLPQEISLIDTDIQAVLLAQVAPVKPAFTDWDVLRQDLAAKQRVIQNRLPATLDTIRTQYEKALAFLENHEWQNARDLLQKIDFPEELARDAQAKIQVLDKLSNSSSAGSSREEEK